MGIPHKSWIIGLQIAIQLLSRYSQNLVLDIIKQSVCKVNSRKGCIYPVWFISEIIKKLEKKNRQFLTLIRKKTNCVQLQNKFRAIRNEIRMYKACI